MDNSQVDIETAIAILDAIAPGAIRGDTAQPGHKYYEGVRAAGMLSKCTCGQRNRGWVFPEYIAKSGGKVWSVGRDAKSNKISCGPNGYHSARYSTDPACC